MFMGMLYRVCPRQEMARLVFRLVLVAVGVTFAVPLDEFVVTVKYEFVCSCHVSNDFTVLAVVESSLPSPNVYVSSALRL